VGWILVSALVAAAVAVLFVTLRGWDSGVAQVVLGVEALVLTVLLTQGPRTERHAPTIGELDSAADQLAQGLLDFWATEAVSRGLAPSTPADSRTGTGGLLPVTAELPGPRRGAALLQRARARDPWTDRDLQRLLEGLLRDRPRLVLLGGAGAGKTSVMILLLLRALRQRTQLPAAERRRAPVPVWVTLSGWDPTTQPLLDWVADVVQRDHPVLRRAELFGPDPLATLWRTGIDDGGRVVLYLDGLDEMPASVRGRALARIDEETAGRPVVLTSREQAYRDAVVSPEYRDGGRHRDDVHELTLGSVSFEQACRYLTRDQPRDRRKVWNDFADALRERRDRIAPEVWSTPLSLSLIKNAYRRGDPGDLLRTLPAEQLADGTFVLRTLQERLLAETYRDQAERDAAMRWLGWIARHMTAEGRTDLEWWEIPRWVSRRAITIRRAALAAATALGVFALLTLLSLGLAALGVIGGVEHADGGFGRDQRLSFADLRLPSMANPLFSVAALAAVVVVLVWVVVAFGGELEHPDGGQPQAIRPRRPTIAELRRNALTLALVAVGVLGFGGWLFARDAGPQGAGDVALEALAGAAFQIGLFVGATWLLHLWAAPATLRAAGAATPASTYARDRQASRWVAAVVGGAMALAAGTLTWWFSTGGLAPTLSQALWVAAAVSVAAGAATGIAFGAGLGAGSLLGLNEGFGVGYAGRLWLAQRGLGSHTFGSRSEGRVDFIALLDRAHGQGHGTGLLRQVGAAYQFRHQSLQTYLAGTAAPAGTAGGGPAGGGPAAAGTPGAPPGAGPPAGVPLPRRPRSRLHAVGAVASAALVFSTVTGAGPWLTSRLPCAQGWRVAASVWWENGQCVGVSEDGTNWFDPTVAAAMASIRRENRAVERTAPERPAVATVAFFAPLSRTLGNSDQQTINARWQLEGVAAAQRRINADAGRVGIKVVVANSGNQFATGDAVAELLDRMPTSGQDGLAAVVGISQSRHTSRSAIATLGDVLVVGASVNGTRMPDDLPNFFMVAPPDSVIARRMHAYRTRDPELRDVRAVVVYDPADTFFSKDLYEQLRSVDAGYGTGALTLGESSTEADVENVAAELCRQDVVPFFAGRADQLIHLARVIDRRPDCAAARSRGITVVAGPGALVAIASDPPDDLPDYPWLDLRYYSLVGEDARDPDPFGAAPGPRAVAVTSEHVGGYTTLSRAAQAIERVRRSGAPITSRAVREAFVAPGEQGPSDDPYAVPVMLGENRHWDDDIRRVHICDWRSGTCR
jgi:hypothetical protein